jgi:hypothetical protein
METKLLVAVIFFCFGFLANADESKPISFKLTDLKGAPVAFSVNLPQTVFIHVFNSVGEELHCNVDIDIEPVQITDLVGDLISKVNAMCRTNLGDILSAGVVLPAPGKYIFNLIPIGADFKRSAQEISAN